MKGSISSNKDLRDSSFSSSSLLESQGSFKLRLIRHQQLHAAIVIERYARGFLFRKRLWSYGGVLYNNRVLRVQCAWRQYLAIQKVRVLWEKKVEKSVHRIHSLFYYWKSRRLRKIIRLSYLKGVITKFQANVRRTLMRKKYLILLFIHKTKNSTKVQSIIRLLLSKNYTLRRKQCIEDVLNSFAPFTMTIAMDQMRNDISFIISQKIMEVSRMIPRLQENIYSFAFSILYDLSINNQMMNALMKSHYLNLCFQKIQYNFLSYLRQNRNLFNKLLYQTANLSFTGSNMINGAPSTSLISQIQNYHHFQMIVQFINYLVRMNLWTKYNKTRQTHFLFLEQSLGILSCQCTIMSYNYPTSPKSESTYSANLNPYSLMSLLMFPKQLFNSRQSMSASSTVASSSSPRSQSSFSVESSTPRSTAFPPTPDAYHAPRNQSATDLLRAASNKSFSFRGSNPAPGAFLQPLLTLAGSVMSEHSESLWQWRSYPLNEILQMMFLISSWHSTSLVKLFDAIIFKVDVLFYLLSFPTLFNSLTTSTKRMLEEFYAALIDFPEDLRDTTITNLHLYESSTADMDDTSVIVHNGLPFYRITARPSTATASVAPAEEEDDIDADLNQIHDIRKFREIQRKRKEKKVVVKVKQISKSPRHRVLHRIWKLLEKAREIVIPGSLDSYELSYRMDLFNSLFQTLHDGYVIRDMIKEFIMVLDAEGNSILPSSSSSSDSGVGGDESQRQKKMRLHQLKNQNKGTSLTVKIHLKIIISGTMIFVTGTIPSPPIRESRNKKDSSLSTDEEKQKMSSSQTASQNANQRLVQRLLYEKIPVFPWPLHPMILFPHEINSLANQHKIFSIQQFSIAGQSDKHNRISRRLSSNQWLDYERFVEYVLSEMSLIFTNNQSAMTLASNNTDNVNQLNFNQQQTFISTDCEPILSFYLPEIHQKRKLLLDNNIMKYSVIIIQRIFRGFLGRKRFQIIRRNYLIMKRKRYLSYKVFYRLKAMYYRHQLAAIQIQRVVKGWELRKEIRRWHFFMLKIQCRIRIFIARKRVREERKRLFDGPQVVLVNRGGNVIEIQSQLIQLFIYRCSNHYKFVGLHPLANCQYIGYMYEKELKQVLFHYNQDVLASLKNDGQSIFSKQQQIQIWQYEKLIGFFYRYINLVPKQINVTTQFANERKEETSYYLAICYQRGSIVTLEARSNSSAGSVSSSSALITVGDRKRADDDEVQMLWRHNYQNLYRSNSVVQSPSTIHKITSEQTVLPPLTEHSRLQKDIPKDFSQHPIIETVKKFQLFKEFNTQKSKKRTTQQTQIKKSQSPKTEINN